MLVKLYHSVDEEQVELILKEGLIAEKSRFFKKDADMFDCRYRMSNANLPKHIFPHYLFFLLKKPGGIFLEIEIERQKCLCANYNLCNMCIHYPKIYAKSIMLLDDFLNVNSDYTCTSDGILRHPYTASPITKNSFIDFIKTENLKEKVEAVSFGKYRKLNMNDVVGKINYFPEVIYKDSFIPPEKLKKRSR